MQRTRRLGLFLCALSAAAALRAQDLSRALRALVESPDLDGARVGVRVLDPENGLVLCEFDADKGFMTASNMKLLSSVTALLTLGPDHRFETRLQADGEIRDGVLHGDLLLVGSGDPTLGGRQEPRPTAPFERMAAALREQGIVEVRGRVIGIDDCQPDEIMGDGWSWGYQGACYAAQMSGLCFAENCIKVRVRGTRPGAPPDVRLTPNTDYVTVLNEARTVSGKAEDRLRVSRARALNLLRVGGTTAPGLTSWRTFSIENPTRFAAHVLREVLLARGIRVVGHAVDLDDLAEPLPPRPRRDLATHRSPPLREIVSVLNKVSQNLYAEQLVRAAGRAAGGDGGMESAARATRAVLERLGADARGLVMADGSGLSRLNLVRPAQIAALLAGMLGEPQFETFYATLPIAGVDGTLRNRFRTGPARGRVRAKTGYISRVVALSGYAPRPDGHPPLVFSVLVNNFICPTRRAKAAVDAFVEEIVRYCGWSKPAK